MNANHRELRHKAFEADNRRDGAVLRNLLRQRVLGAPSPTGPVCQQASIPLAALRRPGRQPPNTAAANPRKMP